MSSLPDDWLVGNMAHPHSKPELNPGPYFNGQEFAFGPGSRTGAVHSGEFILLILLIPSNLPLDASLLAYSTIGYRPDRDVPVTTLFDRINRIYRIEKTGPS